jgi:hypothetical protein
MNSVKLLSFEVRRDLFDNSDRWSASSRFLTGLEVLKIGWKVQFGV